MRLGGGGESIAAMPSFDNNSNRRWWVLAAMTGAMAMVMIDQTVVTVALPRMQQDLDLSTTGVQWVINAYVLALAAVVAPAGWLADATGRLRCYVVGVVGFTLASAACGIAGNEAEILAARAVQGVAAALMMTATAAIVIGAFPLRQRGRAMAIFGTVPIALLAVGPLVGGLLTEYVSWRLVFLINVPVALATLVLTRIARPPADRHAPRSLDAAGIALLVPGIVALVLGLQQSSAWGWGSPPTLGAIAAGAVLLALFVVAERRAREPVVELRLFGDRAFAADNVVLFLTQATVVASVAFTSIFLQNALGHSPAQAGLALLPVVLPMLLVRGLVGRWFDAAGVRPPVRVGTALTALALLALAPAIAARSFPAMVPGLVLQGLGLAFTVSPPSTDALSRAPAHLRGAAAGVVSLTRQLGGTVGLAVIGTIVATHEHAVIAEVGRERAIADSIALGFLVGAVLMVGAFLVSLLVMRGGRQEEETILPHAEPATTGAAVATGAPIQG
jgi:EmrB/QacA subfamily drug resistance transporter